LSISCEESFFSSLYAKILLYRYNLHAKSITFRKCHVDLPHTPVACGGKPSCSAGSP